MIVESHAVLPEDTGGGVCVWSEAASGSRKDYRSSTRSCELKIHGGVTGDAHVVLFLDVPGGDSGMTSKRFSTVEVGQKRGA